jgi:hypothetical protein
LFPALTRRALDRFAPVLEALAEGGGSSGPAGPAAVASPDAGGA